MARASSGSSSSHASGSSGSSSSRDPDPPKSENETLPASDSSSSHVLAPPKKKPRTRTEKEELDHQIVLARQRLRKAKDEDKRKHEEGVIKKLKEQKRKLKQSFLPLVLMRHATRNKNEVKTAIQTDGDITRNAITEDGGITRNAITEVKDVITETGMVVRDVSQFKNTAEIRAFKAQLAEREKKFKLVEGLATRAERHRQNNMGKARTIGTLIVEMHFLADAMVRHESSGHEVIKSWDERIKVLKMDLDHHLKKLSGNEDKEKEFLEQLLQIPPEYADSSWHERLRELDFQ